MTLYVSWSIYLNDKFYYYLKDFLIYYNTDKVVNKNQVNFPRIVRRNAKNNKKKSKKTKRRNEKREKHKTFDNNCISSDNSCDSFNVGGGRHH